jgi:hypothetical protein
MLSNSERAYTLELLLTMKNPTSSLVYKAFILFTLGLIVWSLYAQLYAYRWAGGYNLFSEGYWQEGMIAIWTGSSHAMMLFAAIIALMCRSGAAVWLYTLALTYTVVPKVILVLFDFHRIGLASILFVTALLGHVALVTWALRYLVRKGELRPPM